MRLFASPRVDLCSLKQAVSSLAMRAPLRGEVTSEYTHFVKQPSGVRWDRLDPYLEPFPCSIVYLFLYFMGQIEMFWNMCVG